MKYSYIFLLIIVFCSCSNSKNLPEYDIIENVQFERYGKSQVTLRVALTDTTTSEEDVRELLHSLVETTRNLKMKKREKPTNVYVYIFKTKASFEADPVNWIMMYAKNNSDNEGKYTYQPLGTPH